MYVCVYLCVCTCVCEAVIGSVSRSSTCAHTPNPKPHANHPPQFEPGQYIVREGEAGSRFYIVNEGEVKCLIKKVRALSVRSFHGVIYING